MKKTTIINNNKKRVIKTILLIIFLILIVTNISYAQRKINITPEERDAQWDRTPLIPEDLQEEILDGIKDMHSFDFDKAEKHFINVIKMEPDRIFGYVYMTALNWIRLYENVFNDQAERQLRKYLNLSLNIGKTALTSDNANSYDYLMYALAKTLNARTDLKDGDLLKAIKHLLDAINYVKKADEINKAVDDKGNRIEKVDNIDVLFGLGLYKAYTGALPNYLLGVLKAFTNLEPNSRQGTQNMKTVRDKGTLFKLEARMMMIQIYGIYKNSYNTGRKEGLKVFKYYPRNMLNNLLILDLDGRKREYENGLNFAQNKVIPALKRAINDEERLNLWIQKVNYAIGRVYFQWSERESYLSGKELKKGNKDKAKKLRESSEDKLEKSKEYFINIILEGDEYYKTKPGIELTQDPNVLAAYFRLGLIFDLEGKRSKAKKQYLEVINSTLTTTIKDYAQKFYENKYVSNDKRLRAASYQEYYIP